LNIPQLCAVKNNLK